MSNANANSTLCSIIMALWKSAWEDQCTWCVCKKLALNTGLTEKNNNCLYELGSESSATGVQNALWNIWSM